MRVFCVIALAALLAAPATALAGDPQAAALKVQQGLAKDWVTRSSEKMSEENYGFQPTSDVRTYGKILAHIADANYLLCSMSRGEKSPVEMGSIEKTRTTKADIQKALAESFDYCEQTLAALTPEKAAEGVEFFGMPQTRLSMLFFNVAHNLEHYGNLVTYMRMKGIVPPSSEPRGGSSGD